MLREVIEWIEVTERLPEDERTVMVCAPVDDIYPLWLGWYWKHEMAWYSVSGAHMEGVVRWAEMPKGEAS